MLPTSPGCLVLPTSPEYLVMPTSPGCLVLPECFCHAAWLAGRPLLTPTEDVRKQTLLPLLAHALASLHQQLQTYLRHRASSAMSLQRAMPDPVPPLFIIEAVKFRVGFPGHTRPL